MSDIALPTPPVTLPPALRASRAIDMRTAQWLFRRGFDLPDDPFLPFEPVSPPTTPPLSPPLSPLGTPLAAATKGPCAQLLTPMLLPAIIIGEAEKIAPTHRFSQGACLGSGGEILDSPVCL